MARTTKYDWPSDQKLQALLDEHGTGETARQVGCPASSLSNRIRQRGLRGSKQRQKPDTANANGTLNAANANGKPDAANANGKPDAANANGKPDAAEPSEESVRERTEAGPDQRSRRQESADTPHDQRRRRMPEPLEHLGSADYLVRVKPENPAAVEARSRTGGKADERSGDPPAVERLQEDQEARVKTGADASPSAQRASRPKRRGAALRRVPRALGRVPRALRRVPAPIWRSLAVVCLAAVAGIAAFISVSGDPKTYERESSFAVRPSATVPPGAVNDVLGTLAQPDSAVTETIVNMLGSPRVRSFAAQSAGLPASSVGGSGSPYAWSATRRPGSTIVDVRVTGPDDDKLLAIQQAAGPEAARLVEESYTPYRLETLSAPSPPVQVGPQIRRTVGLALLLGALLGIILVFVERRLRSSLAQREGPSRAPARRGDPWER
jgi:hypothetical protein